MLLLLTIMTGKVWLTQKKWAHFIRKDMIHTMVLIPCNAECKHQQEGYCTLDTITHVTNAQGTCAYYRHKGTKSPQKAPSGQTEGANSVLK